MKKDASEAEWAIKQLQADRRLIGECPHCGERYPLADWLLFYGDSFPPEAEEVVERLYSLPETAKKQYLDLKQDLTVKTGERSLRVKIGNVLEQIGPALPSFPYAGNDCRSLFKPIDYVVFEGLTKREIEFIHFVDVKTGRARMNDHQKDVQRMIEKKRVEFRRY